MLHAEPELYSFLPNAHNALVEQRIKPLWGTNLTFFGMHLQLTHTHKGTVNIGGGGTQL